VWGVSQPKLSGRRSQPGLALVFRIATLFGQRIEEIFDPDE
jgi:hypothetical protein